MPAFSAVDGMPYWIDLTTSDIRKSAHFYSEIMGWEIEASEDSEDYRIARVQGLPVAGLVARPEDQNQPDSWITSFLSTDIDADCERVVELGGRVLVPVTELQLGLVTIVVDSAGAVFGLVQPRGEDSFIAAGEPGTPVWHELTCTTGYAEACEFYPELFGWGTREEDGEQKYTVAMVDGMAFAGIFDAAGLMPKSVPSFWQTYLGVRDVEEVAAKVADLGGEVLQEPWLSPFGKMLRIADSTGAILTLCEVEEPPAEIRESDPLEGIDLSDF